jgi:DNA-binding NarL/FixJ family response regulator
MKAGGMTGHEFDGFMRRAVVMATQVAPAADVDSVASEAVEALVLAEADGVQVRSRAGFLRVAVRRRAADALRSCASGIGNLDTVDPRKLDGFPRHLARRPHSMSADTLDLTPAWKQVLRLMQRGVRTNKGLARWMRRDVKTIKEMRTRLARRLGQLCQALPAANL